MSEPVSELQPGAVGEVNKILLLDLQISRSCRLVSPELLIHQSLDVVLVSTPESFFGIPDGVEGLRPNHQVLRPNVLELRVNFKDGLFGRSTLSFSNLEEIHLTSRNMIVGQYL